MRALPPEQPTARGGDATPDGAAHATNDSAHGFALLVARIAERLRPVCRDWDEPRFQALVLHVARVKVRWDVAYRTAHRAADADTGLSSGDSGARGPGGFAGGG